MRRVLRRPLVLLAALVLAMQAAFATGLQAAIAVDSGAIHIVTLCTAEGYRQIALDRENRPVAPGHDHEECPDCVLTCSGAIASDAAFDFPQAARRTGRFNLDQAVTTPSPILRPFGRGPPSSARPLV